MSTAILESRKVNLTGSELEHWIRCHEGLGEESPVFAYIETVKACSLDPVVLANWAMPADTLAGRVFNAAAEARWQAEAGGTFSAWSVRDVPGGTPESRDVTVGPDTSYYLIGRGTRTPGIFEESRYPGVNFTYPVQQQFGDDHANARAFIAVREYGSPIPGTAEIRAASPEELTMLLNRPRMVAHRFVKVHYDFGGN